MKLSSETPRENEALARVQLLDTCAVVAGGDGGLLMVYKSFLWICDESVS